MPGTPAQVHPSLVPYLPCTLLYPPPATLATTHPASTRAASLSVYGYSGARSGARSVHQAHIVKMEILTQCTGRDTVSERHIRPVRDTVTTFQILYLIRCLIGGNAKGISLFRSKGIINAQKRGKSENRNCTEVFTRRSPVPEQDRLAKLAHLVW